MYQINFKLPLLGLAIIILLSSCHAGSNKSQNLTLSTQYQLVVDAGSSGSRIYLYRINHNSSLPTITDEFESSNSIGLASFATTNPDSAGEKGIQPLLDVAVKKLYEINPKVKLSTINTSVIGTAGMRYLNQSTQTQIYNSVKKSILATGLNPLNVKTIPGQYEGVYSWADVNYISNNFSSNVSQPTTGIIEIGGASAQIAFETKQDDMEDTVVVNIANKDHYLYAISFLGLGQDKARDSMNSIDGNAGLLNCYTNSAIIEKYNKSSFDLDKCKTIYTKVIINEKYSKINNIQNLPDFQNSNFIGISSIYYSMSFWGIDSKTNYSDYLSAISNNCSKSLEDLSKDHPNAYKLENQCANAVFIETFLYDTLKLKDSQAKTVPSINGHDLTWTLGYVLLNK